jgi:hypothetical protein
MKDPKIDVAIATTNLHYSWPVPFQISFETDEGSVGLLTSGLYQRVGDEVRLLLDYQGAFWDEVRVSWSPTNLLKVAQPPGPFQNLEQFLVANDVGEGTLTVALLHRNFITRALESLFPADAKLNVYPLTLRMSGDQQSAALRVGDTVAPSRRLFDSFDPGAVISVLDQVTTF